MRIYNWVKNVLFDGQKTGKTFSERRADNKYLNELKKKFETAYNTAYKGNGETKYSIQTDNKGNKYIKVDTDQNIFDGKTLKEQKEIAKEYILKNFREKGLIKDNQNINVTRKTANEYTYPKNILNKGIASDKMKASTELNNLLNISQYKYSKPDDGRHSFAKNGWEYYETIFQVGNKTYSGLLNIANDGNKKMLYDITNIKEMNSNISMETESSANSSLSNYSIPSTDSTVNNQYMQNNGNNTQGLETSSSFSLPKTWEEVETNVKSRITPEIEKDMKRFVQNNFVDYEKVDGGIVDDYVDEMIKKIYTLDELEYIGDEDLGSEVFDAVYNTVDKFIEEAGYTYKRAGDKSYFEPDMSFLEDSDEIRMEYD